MQWCVPTHGRLSLANVDMRSIVGQARARQSVCCMTYLSLFSLLPSFLSNCSQHYWGGTFAVQAFLLFLSVRPETAGSGHGFLPGEKVGVWVGRWQRRG
jgi:hypothetical protein